MKKYIFEACNGKVQERKIVKIYNKNGKKYFKQEWEDEIGKHMTADNLETINNHDRLFFDKKKAEIKANKIKLDMEEKKKKLNNGYIECAYCGKLIKKENSITDKVISRQYKNYKKEFKYCSGECAKYNQMAHEG